MTMSTRTYEKNKNESRGYQPPMFRRADFEDKENVLILAKTWGAARVFYMRTALSEFKGMKVVYLRNRNDVKTTMNRSNTVVVQLSRALENQANVPTLKLCENKNLKILRFNSINIV